MQAQCVKTETEHYRRLKCELVQVRFVHCCVVGFSYVDNLEGTGLEGRASQRFNMTSYSRGLGTKKNILPSMPKVCALPSLISKRKVIPSCYKQHITTLTKEKDENGNKRHK